MDGKAEVYYQMLLQHLPMLVMCVKGTDGTIQYANQKRGLGIALVEDDSVYDVLRPFCARGSLDLLREQIASVSADVLSEATVPFQVHAQGQPRWYNIVLRKLEPELVLLTFLDMTAQQQVEEENRLLQEQIHIVFDEALDIIAIIDEEERIRRINPVVELLLGYKPEELIGKQFSEMLQLSQQEQQEHEEGEIFTSLANFGAVFTALPFMRKDGAYCYMELTATLVPWRDAQAVMITLRDVTHREELQRELGRIRRAQEKHEHEKALVKARANMIFVIAHQFRTPLTGISMSAQILDRYQAIISPEQYRTHLSRILAHTDHMDSMIQDMLDARQAFTHGLEFEPAPMSLGEYSRAIFEEIAEQNTEKHRFQFRDVTSEDYAMLDPALVKYIVDNLLTNAVKYSPDGGLVSMSLHEEGRMYVMAVSDEGMGIPEESYETIFELFRRGSNVGNIQGTGIGLGLVRICVAQHGGEIDFVSRVGHGTTFTVRIPIVRPGESQPLLPTDEI